jgi:hypothetical protein
MPEITVSPLSWSTPARKVGSSRTKRPSALLKFACDLESFGLIESEITASGTNIEVIATSMLPSVKVSPEAQSTPKSATMSPPAEPSISSISLACMRTSRPTLTRFLVRELVIVRPRESMPW